MIIESSRTLELNYACLQVSLFVPCGEFTWRFCIIWYLWLSLLYDGMSYVVTKMAIFDFARISVSLSGHIEGAAVLGFG